ncbi:hypothetical protein CRUP_004679, partial [Coryphaenoides rupestris]
MRMSELQWSVITCRGLHVDTLDRLPSTILEMKQIQVVVEGDDVGDLPPPPALSLQTRVWEGRGADALRGTTGRGSEASPLRGTTGRESEASPWAGNPGTTPAAAVEVALLISRSRLLTPCADSFHRLPIPWVDSLRRVFVEGASQPGAATAQLTADVAQGVETLQLMAVEMLLHIEPEGQLWGGTRQQGWDTEEEPLPAPRATPPFRSLLSMLMANRMEFSPGGRKRDRGGREKCLRRGRGR